MDDLASINFVHSHPEYRRKHYNENLVYQVTKLSIQAEYSPILYTDADYKASNAYYEKLGNRIQGKLCFIGKIYECNKMIRLYTPQFLNLIIIYQTML